MDEQLPPAFFDVLTVSIRKMKVFIIVIFSFSTRWVSP